MMINNIATMLLPSLQKRKEKREKRPETRDGPLLHEAFQCAQGGGLWQSGASGQVDAMVRCLKFKFYPR